MSVQHYPLSTVRRDTTRRKPRVTVAQLFLRAVQRWQRNRAVNELSRLDDRQLKDIGISRNDIPRVVEGLFHPGEATSGRRAKAATQEDRMRQLA